VQTRVRYPVPLIISQPPHFSANLDSSFQFCQPPATHLSTSVSGVQHLASGGQSPEPARPVSQHSSPRGGSDTVFSCSFGGAGRSGSSCSFERPLYRLHRQVDGKLRIHWVRSYSGYRLRSQKPVKSVEETIF
jgi:hypothetical protein